MRAPRRAVVPHVEKVPDRRRRVRALLPRDDHERAREPGHDEDDDEHEVADRVAGLDHDVHEGAQVLVAPRERDEVEGEEAHGRARVARAARAAVEQEREVRDELRAVAAHGDELPVRLAHEVLVAALDEEVAELHLQVEERQRG
jgi:hypothetical protein